MKNKYTHKCAVPIILCLLYSLINSLVFSQDQPKNTITGVVSDESGPLAGANVLIKNTNQGTITDFDGTYTIRASSTDTLVFTYLGFLTQEISVNLQKQINVLLNSDETSLDQVVLNAGYYKVSEREKTGSISKVSGLEIERQPVSNPLAAMQGRMTGVNIVQNTGVPGGGFSIRIRGRNSIRPDGNEQLYIVDGVPYPSQSLGVSSISSAMDGPQSPLNGISPSDIETIEVLKDADASAIYGSRGANGVVLITTKKGKAGKTQYKFSTE